jgi:hypothetical protein
VIDLAAEKGSPMKLSRLTLLLAALFIAGAPSEATAQTGGSQLTWKPVEWAFPTPGMLTVELDGKKVYQLGKNVYGLKHEHNGIDVRVVLFAPELAAAAELTHIQDPKGLPDVDMFLAAVGVMKAVETPEGFTNKYLGEGKLDGRALYIFETKSGANVGAQVSDKRNLVIVMPAPSVKE